MTSRERVQAALKHQQPDRTPVDFGGHRSSGISAIGYGRLKEALGITTGDIYVYDMIQQLAIAEEDVLDALGVDTIELGRAFMTSDDDWKPWVLPDGTPCKIPSFVNIEKRGNDWYLLANDGTDIGVQKEGCLYFEQTRWPWVDRNIDEQDFSDLEEAFAHTMWTAVPTPGSHIPFTDEGLAELAAGARQLRERTDRAIIGLFGGNLFEVPQWLYRNDNYLMFLAMAPDGCRRLSKALCDFYMERMERWLAAVGPYVDVVLFGDDLGGQGGPFMSPKMYRDYFKPFHGAMWRRAKELAPHVFTNLHCCGGVEPLLDDLIDAGLDSINPVQVTCKDMEAEHLKTKFGDRISLWGGGCDTRHVLPLGTPQEVRDHVRQQVQTLAPGGGFVFQQVHNTLSDVPTENIQAMFEAVHAT